MKHHNQGITAWLTIHSHKLQYIYVLTHNIYSSHLYFISLCFLSLSCFRTLNIFCLICNKPIFNLNSSSWSPSDTHISLLFYSSHHVAILMFFYRCSTCISLCHFIYCYMLLFTIYCLILISLRAGHFRGSRLRCCSCFHLYLFTRCILYV